MMKVFLTLEFVLKFLKFAIVGTLGFFLDFGVTYFCKEILKIQKYISNSLGFITAVISNYFLNRIWTFQSHNPELGAEFVKFIVISLVGLCLNNLIVYLCHGKWNVNFYLAKVIAVLVVTFWNFCGSLFYAFAIV
ncbi:MAG: GtrA family protein [Bacteroidales bacterium]